jgi:signal transduction histidine kinase
MLHRPWHVWLAYLLALALLLPGFAWLTVRALELDRAERLARAAARQEEQLSLALWRMDSLLMPIIAQEAARPHFVYEPSYAIVSDQNGTARVASPILRQPNEFVHLNFQAGADGMLASPQSPPPEQQQFAFDNGLTPGELGGNRSRLDGLRGLINYQELLAELPHESLPESFAATDQPNMVSNFGHQFPVQTFEQQVADASQQGLSDESPAQQQAAVPFSDFQQRNTAIQALASQQARQQRGGPKIAGPPAAVQEGVSRALWVGDQLLLARRVSIAGQTSIQGCWLNWDRLRDVLTAEVADLLPDVRLVPVSGDERTAAQRSLAALPVRLDVPQVTLAAGPPTPMQTALAAAWLGLLVAGVAIAVLLHGVTTLSERRAAFVSAVTHELRTPLTTLQLYTEMLADDLLTDESQRREYIQTLRGESDRLGHLVENVLGYARLERRPRAAHCQWVSLGDLLDRLQPRLERRAARAEMRIVVEADTAARAVLVQADPSVVEQIVFNLVDNSCKYAVRAADRSIVVELSSDARHGRITVRDFGPGIATDVRRRLFQPFSKSAEQAAESAPGVGLGLALSRGLARQMGGELALEGPSGPGAAFSLALRRT